MNIVEPTNPLTEQYATLVELLWHFLLKAVCNNINKTGGFLVDTMYEITFLIFARPLTPLNAATTAATFRANNTAFER